MSELDRYIAQVFEIIESNRGHALETAKAVRGLTQRALASPEFIFGCAERIVTSMENSRRPWRNPPLWQSAEPPLQLRVFYWPPGQTSDPHFHGQWTTTGVLHNEVFVETFDSDQDAEANRAAKSFSAKVGEVGYLMPPCIHRVSNPSNSLSATLHVFSESAAEGKRLPEGKRIDLAPRPLQLDNRKSPVVQRALHLIMRMLDGNDSPAVVDLLVRAFALAGLGTRVQIVKVLVPRNAAAAYSLSRELEQSLSGIDREKISSINREFALACEFRGQESIESATAGVA
jgi:hypothetical protein